MRTFISFFRFCFLLLLFSPRIVTALPEYPATGVWNGYLDQLNVLECVNADGAATEVIFSISSDTGEALGDGTIALPPFGTVHKVLNEFPLADRYGTLTIAPASDAHPRFYCLSMFYRLGVDGLPEYAFAFPFGSEQNGVSSGIYNSMNPENGPTPVANWLSIVNTGENEFSADILVYNNDGTPVDEEQMRVEALLPGRRIDLPLGHPLGMRVGMYRIEPDNAAQSYLAFNTRYGQSNAASYRFAFPLEAAQSSCASQPLPASTMDPALNWLEILNPEENEANVEVSVHGADGSVLHRENREIAPFAQEHIFINKYLGERSTGSITVSCDSESETGFTAQSLFYGLDPSGLGLEWAYASQSEPLTSPQGNVVLTPFNTNLGAANWLKLNSTADAANVMIHTFSAAGERVRVDENTIPDEGSIDYPAHEAVGPNATGLIVAEPAPANSPLSAELLRVFPGDNGIGTIARVPAETLSEVTFADSINGDVVVGGELKTWHPVVLTFSGPELSEEGEPNPFLDYRLQVLFTNGELSFTVPGFFAADGNAAQTSASSGTKWRAYFMPPAPGVWNYQVSFRTGSELSVSDDPAAGSPVAFDGATGSFSVLPSDKTGRDFRGKGLITYSGERYFRFQGTGEPYLKLGTNSPENLLAYGDFDATPGSHEYAPHLGDWKSGDPTWQGSKGQGLIGAINYLAEHGVNAAYFLTMNVTGDGDDVWPWSKKSERLRFDVSKLDQWNIVFSHMTAHGILLHVLTQETENDHLLNNGALGTERKLYYRELIARFAHHPGIVWNLGEENTNSTEELTSYSEYFRTHDPYGHPITVHTFPGQKESVYGPLLGLPVLSSVSLQKASYDVVLEWVERSAQAGQQWVVTFDEQAPPNDGVLPDSADPDRNQVRMDVLWATLMAGGGGLEYYFGYNHPHNDINLEDFRSRDELWRQSNIALQFFETYLPYAEMQPRADLVSAAGTWCLASEGEVYAVYAKSAGAPTLELSQGGSYSVQWYNPRTGGALQNGSVTSVTGPGQVDLGLPPSEPGEDWAVLVTRTTP